MMVRFLLYYIGFTPRLQEIARVDNTNSKLNYLFLLSYEKNIKIVRGTFFPWPYNF